MISHPDFFCLLDVYEWQIVMCRACLGLKARAWAQLEQAQALIYHKPGLGSGLRLGLAWLGLAWLGLAWLRLGLRLEEGI
jgi:hypothetical protein